MRAQLSNFGLLCSGADDKRERMSYKSLNAWIALVASLVCGYSANLVAEEKETRAVTVVVLCEDAFARKMIRESLLKHLRALRDLEVVDKGGYSSLIVYAEKTVNDSKNPTATRSRLLTLMVMS